ncbi:hypothetical protein [Rufibacter latericius]|nr:hypothetical protein [Rufibacter latericius]
MDALLTALLTKVKGLPTPEDHPTLSQEIAGEMSLPLEEVLSLSRMLVQDGFLKISPLHDPPLLYLTVSGVARALRLKSDSRVS